GPRLRHARRLRHAHHLEGSAAVGLTAPRHPRGGRRRTARGPGRLADGPSMTGPMRLVRAAALGGLGVALAARPRDVVATSCGAPVPPAWLVRVLGVRQLAQELLILAAPTRSVLLGAATTDALHAASMGAAALIWPKYRRPALTS